MNKLRNLTITLALVVAAAATASTSAAASTVSHAERDIELRVGMSETVSAGLLAILLANACVVATGVRIAKQRSRLGAGNAHDGRFDIA